jgi:hypothetical protein
MTVLIGDNTRLLFARFAASIAIAFVFAMASAPVWSNSITGNNVVVVRHSQGSFTSRGNGTWIEVDAAGKPGFTFTESGRDDWSVYLKDATRNVDLQLDLHQKRVFYSDGSSNKAPLYDITDYAELNGRTVNVARHSQGTFTSQGNGTWIEADTAGKPGYTFTESGRDDWSVYLKDASRNIDLQLDLHQKKVFYSDGSSNKAPLYDITDYAASP